MAIRNTVNLAKLREMIAAMPASRLAAYISQLSVRLATLLDGNGGSPDPPGTPPNFTSVGGPEQAVSTWDAATDGWLYEVWIAQFPSADFTRSSNTPALSFRNTGLTAGESYTLKVRATNQAGIPGAFSPVITVAVTSAAGPAAPDIPTGLAAVAGGAQEIDLSWNALTGTGVAVTIDRRRGATGAVSTIATGVTGTTFTDIGLTSGIEYFYRIRSVNAEGAESAWTTFVSATTTFEDTTPPPVPDIIAVTAQDSSILIQTNGVSATDLAGYEYGVSTVIGAPYEIIEVDVERFHVVSALTNGTEYFAAVRSYDTSGNRSAWIAAMPATPAAIPDTDPPGVPTGFASSSTVAGSVTLAWDLNTEGDMLHYRIETDEATPGVFVELTTVQQGITSYVRSGLGEEEINYRLYAVDISLNDSLGFAQLAESADGADSGSGSGSGPNSISGDTGLGAAHRAPDATFSFVIDVSGYSGPENSMAVGMAQLRSQVASGEIDLSGPTRPRVAILLPARTENGAVELRASGGYVPGVNGQGIIFPIADTFDVDFIGPWTGGADLAAAKILVSGVQDDIFGALVNESAAVKPSYRITCRYEEDVPGTEIYAGLTGAGVSGGVLNERSRLFGDAGWQGNISFWCCRFSGGGSEHIKVGKSNAPNGNSLDFNLCRFDHDDHIWDPTVFVTNSAGNQTRVTALYPRWGFSTFNALMSFNGCLMDFPYNQEHAVYDRCSPYGDRTWSYVQVTRCGGQVYQQVYRSDEGNLITSPVSDPGNVFWDHVISLGYNRNSSWSSGVVTRYSAHSVLDMQDCVFADVDPANGSVEWLPIIDPQDPLVGLGVFETFGGLQMGRNPEATGQTISAGNYAIPGGATINGGVKMRNCYFYSACADKAMTGFQLGEFCDIADCAFFSGEPGVLQSGYNNSGDRSQSALSFGDLNALPSVMSGSIVLPLCVWANNNTPALKTALATYLGLPEGDFFDPQVFVNEVLVGVGSNDISFTDLPFSGPPTGLVVT